MNENDVEILERETVHDGHARIDRIRLRHRLHEGGWSGTISRELVERGHAAAVLPYDPIRDEVVLIRQFRIGALAAGRDPWPVEIVAGLIEDGETAEDVARRETLEETGCAVADLVSICDCLVSPGIMSETVAIFCARADTGNAGGIHGMSDEDEDIEAFALPVAEALSRLQSGRIGDAKTIIALQWLALNRAALRAKWS
jgi:ADP-ribose pyrophosphatase